MDEDEQGWVGTVLIEPLSVVAGAVLAGALVTYVCWRAMWAGFNKRDLAYQDACLAARR
jgi:hypothetical protein